MTGHLYDLPGVADPADQLARPVYARKFEVRRPFSQDELLEVRDRQQWFDRLMASVREELERQYEDLPTPPPGYGLVFGPIETMADDSQWDSDVQVYKVRQQVRLTPPPPPAVDRSYGELVEDGP